MKVTQYLLATVAFVSFPSMTAIEITKEEAAKHIEIGPITVSQHGDDTIGIDHARLSKAVDKEGGKYYAAIGRERETLFETINAIAYR